MQEDNSFHIAKTTKIKRASFWSSRIVNWKNDELFYYKSEKEASKPRFHINLRNCQVSIIRPDEKPPIMVLMNKGEELLKVDLGSNKFAELIVGKLGGIGIAVHDTSLANLDGEKTETDRSRGTAVRKESLDNLRRSAVFLDNSPEATDYHKKSYGEWAGEDDYRIRADEDSSEEEEERTSFGAKPLSLEAKSYFNLKTNIKERMIFLSRKNGISLFGLSNQKGIGFSHLKRLRESKELLYKLVQLRGVEMVFLISILSVLLFTVLTFSQIFIFSLCLCTIAWIGMAVLIHPQTNFYYLRKDIRVRTLSSHFRSRDRKSTINLDDSFAEDFAEDIQSSHCRPSRMFKGLQGILLKLTHSERRKRFLPLVSCVRVQSQELEQVSEEGHSSYFSTHLLKHGKSHYAVIEIEQSSKQICQIFEMSFNPRTSTLTLSVFTQQSSSSQAFSLIDALSRELVAGCEDEDVLKEAIAQSYFKICEFIPKLNTNLEEFVFEQLAPLVQESPDIAAQDAKPEPVTTPTEKTIQETGADEVNDKTSSVSKADTETQMPNSTSNLQNETSEQKSEGDQTESRKKQNEDGSTIQIPPTPQADDQSKTPSDMVEKTPVFANDIPGGPKLGIGGLNVTPEIPPNVLQRFEQKYAQLGQMMNPHNGKWKESETKNGVKVYEDTTAGDYIRILSMCKIPMPIEELVPYMVDPQFRLKYDDMVRSLEVLKNYTNEIGVMRVVVKGQFPVSDRDFITYISLTRPDTETFVSMSFDAPDYEYPKTKAVRGELEMSASILKKLSSHETEYILVVSSDAKIKGVPSGIIRSKSRQTAYVPLAFLEAVKKDMKKK